MLLYVGICVTGTKFNVETTFPIPNSQFPKHDGGMIL